MPVADHGRVPLPDGFMFGTATAAYQIEGAVDTDGRGVSIWDTFSHAPGHTVNGDSGDVACRHYQHMDDDLDLIAGLGAGAYRFSVSWARVQPSGKGPANPQGIDFYRRLVDGLTRRGILPVGTLYHWDLPQPLQDGGGWPERDTVSRFADYVRLVADALGDQVGQWITINEPWCAAWLGYGTGEHAPGIRDIGMAVAATHHLLLAHGEACAVIRSELPRAQVGISLNVAPVRHATDHPADVAAAWRVDGNRNRLFTQPLLRGRYPADMLEHYRDREPGFGMIRDGDLEIISRPADFLAVNYYAPVMVADQSRADAARAAGLHVRAGRSDPVAADLRVVAADRPDAARTAMGWEVEPSALTELLRGLHAQHPGVPLIVSENGAACHDYVAPDGAVRDPERIEYLDGHIRAVLRARDAGADVRGYFVWSLLDNFEWSYGYSRRFGLVWVDYPSGARIPKDSYRWYRQALAAGELSPVAEAMRRLRP